MFTNPGKIIFSCLGLVGILTSCTSIPAASVADSVTQEASQKTITTQSFTPTTIEITLADLPEPREKYWTK